MLKRMALIGVVTAIVALASCGDDGRGVFKFGNDQIEVDYGESIDLGLVYDDTDGQPTFESDNEDVATVDADGYVTGQMVGTAVVTATSADGSRVATCEVTVLPTNTLYAEPYLGFGGVAADIIKYEERELQYKSLTAMQYGGENDTIYAMLYYFDSNKLYDSSAAYLLNTNDVYARAFDFLIQRYFYAGMDDNMHIFYNYNVIVGMWSDADNDEIVVYYIPYDSASDAPSQTVAKSLMAKARKAGTVGAVIKTKG